MSERERVIKNRTRDLLVRIVLEVMEPEMIEKEPQVSISVMVYKELEMLLKEYDRKDSSVSERDQDFEKTISMYINDCIEILRRNRWNRNPEITEPFPYTDSHELIVIGLKELKDECLRSIGQEPQNWKDGERGIST